MKRFMEEFSYSEKISAFILFGLIVLGAIHY